VSGGAVGTVLGLFALLGAGLVVVVGVSAWMTAHRLRRPPRRTAGWAASRGVPADPGELTPAREFAVEAVALGGAEVEVWVIDGDSAEGPAVVVTPGWGDSKIGALARLEALVPWASRVIAWDPPGFGETAGLCGMGVAEPGMIRELVGRFGDERGVALYGWSLGGGASVTAGDEANVVGVIAEAPYRVARTPAENVLRTAGLPWRVNLPLALWWLGVRLGVGLKWRGFDRAVCAARVKAPVLVVHGTEDAVCPIEDGREIAGACAAGTVVEIEGGGHNDLWSEAAHRARCIEAVRSFGESLRGSPVSLRG